MRRTQSTTILEPDTEVVCIFAVFINNTLYGRSLSPLTKVIRLRCSLADVQDSACFGFSWHIRILVDASVKESLQPYRNVFEERAAEADKAFRYPPMLDSIGYQDKRHTGQAITKDENTHGGERSKRDGYVLRGRLFANGIIERLRISIVN